MNIIDILMVAFVVGLAFLSAKRGFVLSLLNLGAVVLAGALSGILADPVAVFCYNGFFHEKMAAKLYEILPSGSVSGQINSGIDSVLAELPEGLVAIAKEFGFYPQVAPGGEFMTVEAIEESFVMPIVTGAVSIIATVLLFVLYGAVFKAVARMINGRITDKDKHKFVHGSNALLGGVIGIVKGIIPAGIICAVFDIGASVVGGDFAELIGSSYFCRLVAELLN